MSTNPNDAWLRDHERDLSRMRSLLRLLGCDPHIDTNGVVPSLAFDGPKDDDGNYVQVYLLSARANYELAGHHVWSVGVMRLPDGEDLGTVELPSILSDSPAGRLILLDAFIGLVSQHIQDTTEPIVVMFRQVHLN